MDWNTSVTGAEGFNIAGTATSGKKVADIDDFLRDFAQAVRVRLDGILSWNDSTEQALSLKQTQSRVSAYLSVVTSMPTGVWTTVTLDTELFDNLGEFAGSVFTAKAPGYYQVCASIGIQDIADAALTGTQISKNNISEAIIVVAAGALIAPRVGVSKLIYISVNDTVRLIGFQGHGSARDITPGKAFTYLTIHRIS